jgi:hypothetical protein
MRSIGRGSSLCPRLLLSRITESHHAMDGIVAAKICNTLATFFSVQCTVNKLEPNIDRRYEVVSIRNVGEDAGAAFGRGHFVIVHFTGERLSLCNIFLVSAIDIRRRDRFAIAVIDVDSLSGSVIVVSLLEAKEFVAGLEAKLLSALTNVVSGGMVVSIIAHVSVGVGLRSRSPSPFKVGELTCQA